MPPKARAVRPLREEPERVERPERVLRALRVEGVRPEPVRPEPGEVALADEPAATSAMPQQLQ